MFEIKPIIPHYDEGEDAIVWRLGAAVIEQWTNLSPDVQRRIAEQANFVEDARNPTTQLHEQISVLIRKRHPNWDGKDA